MAETEPLVSPVLNPEGGRSSGCCCCPSKKSKGCCGLIWTLVLAVVALGIAIIVKALMMPDLYTRTILFPGTATTFMTLSEDDLQAQVERFVGGIQIQSISFEETDELNADPAFEQLNDYIEKSYPAFHSADYVTYQKVHNYSRLYKIVGTANTSNPYLLMAHLDVVPPGEGWRLDPFNAGVVTDDDGKEWIYGRGSIDDKHSVFGMLEALEYMVKRGERPERSLYRAFGHDEELSGPEGAGEVTKVLQKIVEENGETIGFILDEGEQVIDGFIGGIKKPVILVGVAEKGFLDVELSVTGEQGHSSQPPSETTIGILASAVAKVEERKHPSTFGKVSMLSLSELV
jgi:carboxypeptidase PM20D1